MSFSFDFGRFLKKTDKFIKILIQEVCISFANPVKSYLSFNGVLV